MLENLSVETVNLSEDVFLERVTNAMESYATLLIEAAMVTSMSELDVIAKENEAGVQVHLIVAKLMRYEQKGLVKFDIPADRYQSLKDRVESPVFRYFQPPARPESWASEEGQKWLIDILVANQAAQSILDVEYLVDQQVLQRLDVDLVHELNKEVVH